MIRQLEEQKSAFLPFPVFATSSFPHCWQQESLFFPGMILFLLQYILIESLLSPVISAILKKLFPFFLSRSILFFSSLVTVLTSLKMYEGLVLHLFKEFWGWELRGGRRKIEKKVAGVIRSYSWIKEKFLLHLHKENRWSDCYTRLPQRLYLFLLFIGHLIVLLNRLKVTSPTSLRTVGWRLIGWAHKKEPASISI